MFQCGSRVDRLLAIVFCVAHAVCVELLRLREMDSTVTQRHEASTQEALLRVLVLLVVS